MLCNPGTNSIDLQEWHFCETWLFVKPWTSLFASRKCSVSLSFFLAQCLASVIRLSYRASTAMQYTFSVSNCPTSGAKKVTTELAPAWIPDDAATHCMICSKVKFSPVVRRVIMLLVVHIEVWNTSYMWHVTLLITLLVVKLLVKLYLSRIISIRLSASD